MAFQGCTFLIAGSFKGGHTTTSIAALIHDNAGTVTTKFSTNATHLLVSDNEFIKRASPKTRAVLENNADEAKTRISVIDQAWLLESISLNQREPEDEWDLELNSTQSDIEQDALDREMAAEKKERKKRKRADSVARESTPTSAGSQEMPATVVKGALVPVDSQCPLSEKCHVHQAKDGTYWHAHVAKPSENKSVIIQLLKSNTKTLFWVWTRGGKNGTPGKSTTFGPVGNLQEAIDQFRKRFKERTKISWKDRMNTVPVKDKYIYTKPEAVDDMDDFLFDDEVFAQIDNAAAEASKPKQPKSLPMIPQITVTAADDDFGEGFETEAEEAPEEEAKFCPTKFEADEELPDFGIPVAKRVKTEAFDRESTETEAKVELIKDEPGSDDL